MSAQSVLALKGKPQINLLLASVFPFRTLSLRTSRLVVKMGESDYV